tara:strand:+ start:231 stop:461 length:231 start_codon:yes stop_codon:yes gene_type:complete
MTNSIKLVPAYGRDYKNVDKVIKDFHKNLDFRIQDVGCPWDGRMANLEDLKHADYTDIYIRYDKLRKVCQINLPLS